VGKIGLSPKTPKTYHKKYSHGRTQTNTDEKRGREGRIGAGLASAREEKEGKGGQAGRIPIASPQICDISLILSVFITRCFKLAGLTGLPGYRPG